MTEYLAQMGTVTFAFLALTDDLDASTKRMIAIRALALAFVGIAAFAFGGQWLFEAFGITLPALRIAGGILVVLFLVRGGWWITGRTISANGGYATR